MSKRTAEQNRRREIIELAKRPGGVSSREIIDKFNIDLHTVWGDIAAIKSEGVDVDVASKVRLNGRITAQFAIRETEES